MSIFKKIKILEKNSSTNFKLEFLKENSDDELLKEFFYLALNPRIRFWIKQIGNYVVTNSETKNITLSEAYKRLEVISSRKKTGDAAKYHLHNILAYLSDDDQEIIKRIIKKDPNCGVSYTTVNKVWKKLIPVQPYMGALSSTKKNLAGIDYSFGAYVQEKADGLYIDLTHDGHEIRWTTRAGNEFKEMSPQVNRDAKIVFESHGPFAMNGELRVLDEKYRFFLDRQTGNGLLNSMQQGEVNRSVMDRTIFSTWDIITYQEHLNALSNDTYDVRFQVLESHINDNSLSNIELIESEFIYSQREAFTFYKKKLQQGKEGAILKNRKAKWKSGKHKDQVKLKIQEPVDLIIYDWLPHKKKLGWIGSFLCRSECGKVEVKVGGGLKDSDRKKPFSFYDGKILEVYSNGVVESKSKEKGKFSLYLPTLGTKFGGPRDDKNVADTLEEIQEKFDNALDFI